MRNGYAREEPRRDWRGSRPGEQEGGWGIGNEPYQGSFEGNRYMDRDRYGYYGPEPQGQERWQGQEQRYGSNQELGNMWRGGGGQSFQGQGWGERFGQQGSRGFGGHDYRESQGWHGQQSGMGAYGQGSERWQGESSGRYGETRREQGGRTMKGRHYGKGPRGYKRSDERIQEEISDCLMRHPDIDASEIEVEVSDGEVVLKGTVEERYLKHELEDLAESILGVKDVTNQVRLRSRDDESSSTENRQSTGKRQQQQHKQN